MKKFKSIPKVIMAFSTLQLFAGEAPPNQNTHTTANDGAAGGSLSAGMKEYYDTELLENARTQHYFAQFGKKQGLPKGRGKTAEWRKWNTFPSKIVPLTEGVTPDGSKFGQTSKKATIKQYGDYATISDVLELTYCDDIILGATEEFGAAGAETMDIVIRNEILSDENQNVLFAPKPDGTPIMSRSALVAGCYLTPWLVNKAVTILKKNKVPRIKGDYIALIHPSVSMDIRECDGWLEAHKYASPEQIYNGEIGKLHGCRFIETTNVKVWGAGESSAPTDLSVYGCIFFGLDAWGVIDPEGAGMEMIVKGKGSSGTADPLNQRSTVGYKFSNAARVLYPERIIRVECVSSFGADDVTN
ncbi:MAG: N4-gp56 family major capsid protein [Acetobacter sp.]|nr:N4-gp56 family major capsid protein [Bacteroides sp.]MCM1342054.1 N4-gp56 family major capsid protein [Acetobacter sp.]MCM1434260.1 N4-gp56 family major capsid protein [Clostridiales bacterium]